MTFPEFQSYCLAKKGTEETYPHGDVSAWYKVMGKMFALTMTQPFKYNGEMAEAFAFVNLKCDPEKAIDLREQYAGILPGWHQSKKHWNSVMMDGSVPDELICELIDHSYDLVCKSLTKKAREELASL